MNDRLEQLRVLIARLERMPACAERDWMLGEVRARAVDVETGVRPTAMRAPLGDGAEAEMPAAPAVSHIEPAEPVPRPQPKRRAASRRPVERAAWGAPCARPQTPGSCSPGAAGRQRAAAESVVDLLQRSGVLSLDDQPTVADGASRPWSGGLRG